MRLRTLLFVLALLPGPALAQEYFGAIAYSRSDRAHGWAKDYASRGEAEKAAVANCEKHGRDCLAVLWFKNGCGALATGPKGAGWAWDEKQSVADRGAVAACAKHSSACVVTQRVCTTRD